MWTEITPPTLMIFQKRMRGMISGKLFPFYLKIFPAGLKRGKMEQGIWYVFRFAFTLDCSLCFYDKKNPRRIEIRMS